MEFLKAEVYACACFIFLMLLIIFFSSCFQESEWERNYHFHYHKEHKSKWSYHGHGHSHPYFIGHELILGEDKKIIEKGHDWFFHTPEDSYENYQKYLSWFHKKFASVSNTSNNVQSASLLE